MLKIKVPATSANLGSGFDALGLALTMYNTVYMEEYDGIRIESLDETDVPLNEHNLIYSTARRLYDICGVPFKGLHIQQINDIPMTRGLGSSSACLIAGLLGANELLGQPMGNGELLNLAAAIEGHPDNVAPALLGGLVTCAMDEGLVHSVSVPVSRSVRFAVMIPDFTLKTSLARSVLPQSISRSDAVFNLSRAALMTSSLFSGNLEHLRIATQDKLHQPYRLDLIRGGEAALRIARELGSYGSYISGAGPSIVAIIDAGNTSFEKNAASQLMKNGIFDWRIVTLDCDENGAYILSESE